MQISISWFWILLEDNPVSLLAVHHPRLLTPPVRTFTWHVWPLKSVHFLSFPSLNLLLSSSIIFSVLSSIRISSVASLFVGGNKKQLFSKKDLETGLTADILGNIEGKGRTISKVFLVIRCRFKFETMRPLRSSSLVRSTSSNLNCKIEFSFPFYLWGCPRPNFIRTEEEQQYQTLRPIVKLPNCGGSRGSRRA